MDVANANNVTFYPVDSRGLAAFDRDISENPVLGPAAEIRLVRSRVESLRTLADNTDGLAVVDTNDLDKGFQRIVDDMTSYYLLGYYSTNTALDGKVRKIKVRVKRDGVDVRARRSYRAATEEEIEQGTAQMTAAAAAAPASAVQVALNSIGSSRAGVPLRTAVSYAKVGGGARRAHMWALAELDPGLLRGDEWLGGGEVDVLLQSADGTKIDQRSGTLASGQRSLNIDLGEVALPEGELVVRTRVKPAAGGLPVSDTIRLAIARWRRSRRAGAVAPGPDHRRTICAHGGQAVPPNRPRPAGVAVVRKRRVHVGGGTRPLGQSHEHPRHHRGANRGHAHVGDGGMALAPLAVGDYALRLKTERAGQVERSGDRVQGDSVKRRDDLRAFTQKRREGAMPPKGEAVLRAIAMVFRPSVPSVAFTAVSGQQDTGQRFRAEANLMRVDVYPITEDGQAVTDLTADDFEVREDNVPQAVAAFEHVVVPKADRRTTA